MSLYTEFKRLLDKVDYISYMETVEGDWCTYDDEVYYESNNDVYSGEVREGTHRQDDCTLINIDNGCGETITLVLNNTKYMSYGDFYDKYEEHF